MDRSRWRCIGAAEASGSARRIGDGVREANERFAAKARNACEANERFTAKVRNACEANGKEEAFAVAAAEANGKKGEGGDR